ncbi:class I SAM-dependent methyltransferase [Pleionea sp. CnH1-48]|uniref:class I SAM-dependent methyltransferase n=1 Tax=Pleionea sp. CnH1-48 TaxID=2954494 RepID=UPI002097C097|nr:class I SAM-dependent methyltransferase [Pleionea sp. CnH1-48]MCO7222694.1 class I SAM-dependent methyltransferase [Pleionea sp. CnH1-48]
MGSSIRPGLTDVPETMLVTLRNRAEEAQRSDGILDDKKAIEIYQSIDYDFDANFGKPDVVHALRAITFDKELEAFLQRFPDGVVINLGEGLETQRYRINHPDVRWLTVDLPESIKVREKFISPDEQYHHIALSALDRSWFQQVPQDKPVFITAQGLLMYFTEDEARNLISDIFDYFPRCCLLFDTIPKWMSNLTTSKKGWAPTKNYTAPKMPWGIDKSNIMPTFRQWVKKDVSIADIGYPSYPRFEFQWTYALFSISFFKRFAPSIVKLSYLDR